MSSIESLVSQYVNKLNQLYENSFQTHGYEVNSKYIKIFRKTGGSRNVHSFVNKNTGEVHGAKGWKGCHTSVYCMIENAPVNNYSIDSEMGNNWGRNK